MPRPAAAAGVAAAAALVAASRPPLAAAGVVAAPAGAGDAGGAGGLALQVLGECVGAGALCAIYIAVHAAAIAALCNRASRTSRPNQRFETEDDDCPLVVATRYDNPPVVWDGKVFAGRVRDLESDKQFLTRLIRRVSLLGFINFLLIPCLFFVTLFEGQVQSHAALVGIAAKALVGLALQVQISRDVAAWHGMHEELTSERFAWLIIGHPTWAFHAFLAMIEFIDSDLDAINAGESWGLPFELKDRIRISWKYVPFLGRIVAFLGISGCLTLILVVASAVQLYEFHCMLFRLRNLYIPQLRCFTDPSIDAADKRAAAYLEVQHACDTSSVTFVAEIFHILAKREIHTKVEACRLRGVPPGYAFAGRSSAFKCKVLIEASPSLWFSITFLQCTIGQGQNFLVLIAVLSASTSIACIAKASVSEYRGGVAAMRAGWIYRGGTGPAESRRISWGAVFRLTVWTLNMELLLANVVRFAGLWYCESHTFNFSALGCVDFDA